MSWDGVDWELFKSEILKDEPPAILAPEEGWMTVTELAVHFDGARRNINAYVQRGLEHGVLESAMGLRKDRLNRMYHVIVYRWKADAPDRH